MVNRNLKLSIINKGKSAFLFGPRGVGKTFLAKRFLDEHSFVYLVDLLKYDVYSRYLKQPELFRKEVEKKINDKKCLLVLIDEVQKLPRLLDEVHYLIEEHKGKIHFLLTGSSARKLKRSGANLLAGRAWTLKLHPLSFLEIEIDLEKVLKYGSLPSVYLDDDAPKRTLKAYVETYLKEEIMQEALVRKVENFVQFLDVAGQMNGEPLNFTQIGKECNVSVKTAQEFYSILEDTMLAFKINGWTYSVRKQIQQRPKYYFFDCGVLNAIRGELKTELKKSTFRYGKLFETYMVQEIIRQNDYLETDYKFYYWRTNTGLEVDIILSRGPKDIPIAIEIKSKSDPGEKDFKALKSFALENKKARLVCLCTTPDAYNIDKIEVLPWREGIITLLR